MSCSSGEFREWSGWVIPPPPPKKDGMIIPVLDRNIGFLTCCYTYSRPIVQCRLNHLRNVIIQLIGTVGLVRYTFPDMYGKDGSETDINSTDAKAIWSDYNRRKPQNLASTRILPGELQCCRDRLDSCWERTHLKNSVWASFPLSVWTHFTESWIYHWVVPVAQFVSFNVCFVLRYVMSCK